MVRDALTQLECARFGVYLHFPYCLSKCPYCDFASVAAQRIPSEAYTRAILRELELRATQAPDKLVESIYVGGGTPSLWKPQLLGQVLAAVRARFDIAADCEVTLEANPGASDTAHFAAYRDLGINRLSIGVQSFTDATLTALGRSHDPATASAAFAKARTAGFDNVSLDFMYGASGQRVEDVRGDAESAVALRPEHLSAYALTLGTDELAVDVPLGKRTRAGTVQLPDDDTVVAMQREIARVYAAAGYERYEISNYSLPGRHARHNALYWTGGEYFALGVGATGTLNGPHGTARRYANHRSAPRYLKALSQGELPTASEESLSRTTLFEERVMLGLRLCNGVDLDAARRSFGQPQSSPGPFLVQLQAQDLATINGGRVALTSRGMDLHTAIAARLL